MKTQFLDIPEGKRLKFHRASYNAEALKFIILIEKHDVEINSIIDEFNSNFLTEAISDCFSEFQGSDNQKIIIEYLIDKGIDVNHKTKEGYVALDLTIQEDNLSHITLLLLKAKNIDVHKAKNLGYYAVRTYVNMWREEQKEGKKIRFKIIEELLKKNINLKGCHFWVEKAKDEKLIELLGNYKHTLASLKELDIEKKIDTSIDIDKLHNTVNKKNYDKTAKVIWQKLVPSRGQADTVQGELLRAIEKLRDEAQRNGNVNFNKNCHGLLVVFLQKYLLDETIFTKQEVSKIKKDLKKLSFKTIPYTEDDIYNNITKRIIDWYLENPKQLTNVKNDKLYC